MGLWWCRTELGTHLALKSQIEGLPFNVGCETGHGKGKGCVLLNEQEA